jgi:hypothetical protein
MATIPHGPLGTQRPQLRSLLAAVEARYISREFISFGRLHRVFASFDQPVQSAQSWRMGPRREISIRPRQPIRSVLGPFFTIGVEWITAVTSGL